ncbi:unnamed protein product [Blepharisma stoltei]|uniref:Uncharacterized protein n=1 Tax=Blepharisma stoltei TaxID=1481888 RepID=A0AAU9K4V3_9CILI|nr:unnamed protein product [Blepharisma stoltei]
MENQAIITNNSDDSIPAYYKSSFLSKPSGHSLSKPSATHNSQHQFSIESSPICSPVRRNSEERGAELNPDLIAQLLKDIDTSRMNFVDRMVFDINRKTLLQKSMSQYNETQSKSSSTKRTGVFERLLEDVNRRFKIKTNIKEYSEIEEKNQTSQSVKILPKAMTDKVYQRLEEDTKKRKIAKKVREIIKKQEEESVERTKEKQISKNQARELVKRLTADAKRRLEKIEEKRREKEMREEESIIQWVKSRHPSRPLNPEIEERLTNEKKVIEDLYGLPGQFVSSNFQEISPPRKQFTLKEATESGKRLMSTKSLGRKKIQHNEYNHKPAINSPSKYKHVKPRYCGEFSKIMRCKSTSNIKTSPSTSFESSNATTANHDFKELIKVADNALKNLENTKKNNESQLKPPKPRVPCLKLPFGGSSLKEKLLTNASTVASIGMASSNFQSKSNSMGDYDFVPSITPDFVGFPVRLRSSSINS